MEYFEDERGRPVYNLQRFLRTISKSNDKIYPVVPDGIFGEDTKRSVESFQAEYGLDITGEADFSTWEAIVREYEICVENLSAVHGIKIIKNEQIIKENESADAVYIIQAMIVSLAERFENINAVSINGVYDGELRREVEKLKQIFGQNGTDIDKKFINELAVLYENAVVFKSEFFSAKEETVENDEKKIKKQENDVIVWNFF